MLLSFFSAQTPGGFAFHQPALSVSWLRGPAPIVADEVCFHVVQTQFFLL